MDFTNEETEMLSQLRQLPKSNLPVQAFEKMNELIKQDASNTRKKTSARVVIGIGSGIAAACVLGVGIMNYDLLKAKFTNQTAADSISDTQTAAKLVPNEFDYYGTTVHMDKVAVEAGSRKANLARMLGEWRDKIDENNMNDAGVDLTAYFSGQYAKLVTLFPELSIENRRIYEDGYLYEANKNKGTSVQPPKGWNEEKQAKYEEMKKSNLLPFLSYMNELGGNAGMHDARHPKSDLDNEKIKLARDTYDMYSKYFTAVQPVNDSAASSSNTIITDAYSPTANNSELGARHQMKTSLINYRAAALQLEGNENEVKTEEIRRTVE